MRILEFSSIALIILMIVSCKEKTQSDVANVSLEEKTKVSSSNVDTISQATFNEWTSSWDSLGAGYNDTALVKFYSFPMIDMVEFLGTKATKAFFYQGLESKGSGKYEAHLILTGSDKNGNSINRYYDVTKPCPPFCGPF